MAIHYYNDDTKYRFSNRRIIGRWLRGVAQVEGYKMGEIGVIFCSSKRLLEMNQQYLQHDYFTDIITFDNSDLEDAKEISGELYIDVETVSDNAKNLNITPLEEMHRIIVHGILHLCGQGDKTDAEATQMREKENHYLKALADLSVM